MPAKSIDGGHRRSTSAGRQAEQRPVQAHVLAAGQLGVEAGTQFKQRRDTAMRTDPLATALGSSTPHTTCNRVDLPAPLRPMMPTTSPRRTLRLTWLSAGAAGHDRCVR
jgi:hypothetical protein